MSKIFQIIFFLTLSNQVSAQRIWTHDGMISQEKASGIEWPPKISVEKAKHYSGHRKNDPHFDCDDFTYAYKLWWTYNYPKLSQYVWTVVFLWTNVNRVGREYPSGHTYNALEVYYHDENYQKFCVVTPQSNKQIGECWVQERRRNLEPRFHRSVYHYIRNDHFDYLERENEGAYKILRDTLRAGELFNETRWVTEGFFEQFFDPPWAEKSFYAFPAALKMFKDETGLDPKTMKPLRN